MDVQRALKISNRLFTFIVNTFLKNLSDSTVIYKCLELVEEMSRNFFFINTIQETVVPIFLNLLTNPTGNPSQISDAQCAAYNVISSLVKYSHKPLGRHLLENVFPTVYRVVMSSTSTSVIEVRLLFASKYIMIYVYFH